MKFRWHYVTTIRIVYRYKAVSATKYSDAMDSITLVAADRPIPLHINTTYLLPTNTLRQRGGPINHITTLLDLQYPTWLAAEKQRRYRRFQAQQLDMFQESARA
jgi:hypothetical protein